jgi:hypothetical protein
MLGFESTYIHPTIMVDKLKKTEWSTAPPPIPNKDLYQRVNYTIQASLYLQGLASSSSGSGSLSSSLPTRANSQHDRKGKRRAMNKDKQKDSVVVSIIESGGVGSLARKNMKGTRDLVEHNQLKLYVGLLLP